MVELSILKKEYRCFKNNMKARLISTLGIIFFIALITGLKISQDTNLAVNTISYSSIIVGYMLFITNLRFWYEKSMNMLEVIFMLPCQLSKIILGKSMLPILISFFGTTLFYAIMCVMFNNSIEMEVNLLFNFVKISISLLWFECVYSVINCYAMWCASMSYAKVIQFISFTLYLGSIFLIFLIPDTGFNLTVVIITLLIISIYSLFCYKKIDKEKAINTLHI